MPRRIDVALPYIKDSIYPFIPKLNYFWCHAGYIAFMSLLGGLILWAQEPIEYLDGLFVASSALCVTGLSSVDFSLFRTSSQVMVMIWIKLGGLIFISMIPLLIRMGKLLWLRHKKPLSEKRQIHLRILIILLLTIMFYQIFLELGAFVAMGSYIEANEEARKIVTHNGVRNYGVWWWSIFYSLTSFQNAGFALFSNSLIPFANNNFISLTLAFLIMAGYNLWPVFLRTILFVESKFLRGKNRAAVRYLLDNPRQFYYLLFPLKETMIVLGAYMVIVCFEYSVSFTEWHHPGVYAEHYTPGEKLQINFFQTVAVRNCGLNNVNIGALQLGHLALYIITMYISPFPFIVTIQTTRRNASALAQHPSYQAKRILVRDLTWLAFAIFLICIIEENRESTSVALFPNSFLQIVFEISSAFGTVGLSMGVPNQNYSYSGILHPVSKFIIICIFFCGRHRGLPDSLDPAIYILSEESSAEEPSVEETSPKEIGTGAEKSSNKEPSAEEPSVEESRPEEPSVAEPNIQEFDTKHIESLKSRVEDTETEESNQDQPEVTDV